MANTILGPKFFEMRDRLWGPNENHGISSDCPNPYCDYMMTDDDWNAIEFSRGYFDCPKCGWRSYMPEAMGESTRQRTRSGMSLSDMGSLGEEIVFDHLQKQPFTIGQLVWKSPTYNDPIDAVIGQFAAEIKSLHSEAFPRVKIAADPSFKNRGDTIRAKEQRVRELQAQLGTPLEGSMLAVRINFFNNRADFFHAVGFKDRLLTAMEHIATTDFTHLNPFSNPADVPAVAEMEEQGWTVSEDDGIPF